MIFRSPFIRKKQLFWERIEMFGAYFLMFCFVSIVLISIFYWGKVVGITGRDKRINITIESEDNLPMFN